MGLQIQYAILNRVIAIEVEFIVELMNTNLFFKGLSLLLVFAFTNLYAQKGKTSVKSKIDTVFYDKNWKGVGVKDFAEYYRVIYLPPLSSNEPKRFKDYYITGELQAEGCFVSIDKSDDSKSRFDGEVYGYFKNGLVQHRSNYKNGVRDGEHLYFTEDGLCVQDYYDNGVPRFPYVIVSSADGRVSKINRIDSRPYMEDADPKDRQTFYDNGAVWQYYQKNGLTVALNCTYVKEDYGKWNQCRIIIRNNSLHPIEFNPGLITALCLSNRGELNTEKVLSADEYMRKVRRIQNLSAVATGISAGLSNSNAGYSTSTSTTSYSGSSSSNAYMSSYGNKGYSYGSAYGTSYYSGSETTRTVTYDAAAAAQQRALTQQRLADYDYSQKVAYQRRSEGYLRRTTINPGDELVGYVNVERSKGSRIDVNLNISGVNYEFSWSY